MESPTPTTSFTRALGAAAPFWPSVTVWGRESAFTKVTFPTATVISGAPNDRSRIVTDVTSAGAVVGAGALGSAVAAAVLGCWVSELLGVGIGSDGEVC